MAIRVAVQLVMALVLATGMQGRTWAQEVSEDIVDATVGEWLIASDDGSLGCLVTLQKNKTIGGRAVTEGKVCGPPWHNQIAAWDFASPGIVLRDATRKQLIGFAEREVGPWATDLDTSPRIYFVPAPGNMVRAATEPGAYGKWVLRDKNGKSLCHLTLLQTRSSRDDDSKGAELGKDCAGSVRKTKIDAWQIDDIKLAIIGGEEFVYVMTPDADGFVTEDGKHYLRRDE